MLMFKINSTNKIKFVMNLVEQGQQVFLAKLF